jgi:hypothetical protein
MVPAPSTLRVLLTAQDANATTYLEMTRWQTIKLAAVLVWAALTSK